MATALLSVRPAPNRLLPGLPGPSPRPRAPPQRRGCPSIQAARRQDADSGGDIHGSSPVVKRSVPRPAADPDLLEVLELATDEELAELHATLHGRSLFSPVLKSLALLAEEDGGAGGSHGPARRDALITAIDRRLRFLAADPGSTLRGRWPAYRQVLLMLRDRLGLRCPATLLTNELEAEVFLHLLAQHADAVGAAGPASRAAAAAEYVEAGDGGAAGGPADAAPSLAQRLLAPLRLGQAEVAPALARLGSALALSNLQAGLVQRLGLQYVRSRVQYEAALQLALTAGAQGVKGGLQGRVAVKAAQEGITAAAGRYAAARSLLGVLGPLVWASTALELLSVSLGTDWSRVVRAVYALAQIRLLRTHGFSAPAPPPA